MNPNKNQPNSPPENNLDSDIDDGDEVDFPINPMIEDISPQPMLPVQIQAPPRFNWPLFRMCACFIIDILATASIGLFVVIVHLVESIYDHMQRKEM